MFYVIIYVYCICINYFFKINIWFHRKPMGWSLTIIFETSLNFREEKKRGELKIIINE